MSSRDPRNRVFLAGAAAAAVALAAVIFLLAKIPPAPRVPPSAEGFGPSAVDGARTDAQGTGPSRETEARAGAEALAPSGTRNEVAPSGVFLEGQVEDRTSGEPVPLFELQVERAMPACAWVVALCETIRDPAGSFHVPVEGGGSARLTIRSPGHIPATLDPVALPDRGGVRGIRIRLERGLTLQGRVVDATTGAPVSGAIVLPYRPLHGEELPLLLDGREACCAYGRTGEEGAFVLSGLNPVDFARPWQEWIRVCAFHPEYAAGMADLSQAQGAEVLVRLAKGPCCYGRVLDNRGNPCGGALIFARGEGECLFRPVKSGEDGTYRTAPLPGGEVHLVARFSSGVESGEEPRSAGIAPQEKRVRIADRDLEVDFGPDPAHASWLGTLRDAQGDPLAGAEIRIHPCEGAATPQGISLCTRSERTGIEGGFAFRALDPGAWAVEVLLGQPPARVDAGCIALERPGSHAQDLKLAGGGIAGTVADARTGEPLREASGSVTAVSRGEAFQVFHAPIDPSGDFRLTYLPSGRYEVRATVYGKPASAGVPIVLAAGERVEGLLLAVPRGGRLALRLEGFARQGPREFRASLEAGGGAQLDWGRQRTDRAGAWQKEEILEAGEWTLTMAFEGQGRLERSFQVSDGGTVQIAVRPEDLQPDRPPRCVAGSLIDSDGAPLPGATIFFEAGEDDAYEGEGSSLACRTDEEGCFSLQSFTPGTWRVRAVPARGGEVRFPDLVVPEEGAGAIALALRVPGGSVQGVLLHAADRSPLDESGPRWWITLRDAGTRRSAAALEGGRTGSAFRLEGVPEGRYRLQVSAQDLCDFVSEPFPLGEGQCLDLGEIALEPCAVLELEVKDSAGGEPVEIRVFCDDVLLEEADRRRLGPGKYRYAKVPAGARVIRIVADERSGETKVREMVVDLEPGKVMTLRVDL